MAALVAGWEALAACYLAAVVVVVVAWGGLVGWAG